MHRSTPKLRRSVAKKIPDLRALVTRVYGEQMKKMYEYESAGEKARKGEGIEAEERIEASKSGGMKGDPGARVVDLCSKSSHCRPCAVRDVSQVFSFPT